MCIPITLLTRTGFHESNRKSLLSEFELRISPYFVPFNLYALLAIVPLIHLSPLSLPTAEIHILPLVPPYLNKMYMYSVQFPSLSSFLFLYFLHL
jgi:hypothetical protein